MLTCFGFLFYFTCQPVQTQPDTFCQIYHPVSMSHSDTRLTKEQVDTNNRVYKKLCK